MKATRKITTKPAAVTTEPPPIVRPKTMQFYVGPHEYELLIVVDDTMPDDADDAESGVEFNGRTIWIHNYVCEPRRLPLLLQRLWQVWKHEFPVKEGQEAALFAAAAQSAWEDLAAQGGPQLLEQMIP